jgi:lysophospholipase L1-like esterase
MSIRMNCTDGRTSATRRRNILFWQSAKKILSFVLAGFGAGAFAAAAEGVPKIDYKFDFGGKTPPGYKMVNAIRLYSGGTGYGFEPGSTVTAIERGGKDALRDGFVTSNKPFFFSATVPEGNYRVTVMLGDRAGESASTVKAELRRLMLENAQTRRGVFETRSFIVNVRRPQIPGGGHVEFKDRERTSETWAWDDKLTLEFSGKQPKLCALTIEKIVDIPTIYIAGDSTSTDQAREPYNSWGQMLTRFFKPEIALANNGESGESARSFISEHRWDKVMSVIRPGDYVFVQFGHNDQKDTSPGAGAFTSYKTFLKRFVADARQHGATPVLITPVNRRTFDANGKITNSLGDFPEAVRQVAAEDRAALIDLNAMSRTLYEALGPEQSGRLFAGKDATHHNDYGSYELAKCIVLGIQEAKLPIAKYLASDISRFDPAHPDSFEKFDLARDPEETDVKPYGR